MLRLIFRPATLALLVVGGSWVWWYEFPQPLQAHFFQQGVRNSKNDYPSGGGASAVSEFPAKGGNVIVELGFRTVALLRLADNSILWKQDRCREFADSDNTYLTTLVVFNRDRSQFACWGPGGLYVVEMATGKPVGVPIPIRDSHPNRALIVFLDDGRPSLVKGFPVHHRQAEFNGLRKAATVQAGSVSWHLREQTYFDFRSPLYSVFATVDGGSGPQRLLISSDNWLGRDVVSLNDGYLVTFDTDSNTVWTTRYIRRGSGSSVIEQWSLETRPPPWLWILTGIGAIAIVFDLKRRARQAG